MMHVDVLVAYVVRSFSLSVSLPSHFPLILQVRVVADGWVYVWRVEEEELFMMFRLMFYLL